jgi:spore maturation protein CgeB
MKVLVAGDWHSDLHEEVVVQALRSLGHDVHGFKWAPYFQRDAHLGRLSARIQNKVISGPLVSRLNQDLVRSALLCKPHVVLVYRGTHVLPATVALLKAALPQARFVSYNNDNPFAPGHSPFLWRHFLQAIPQYDLVLGYRHADLQAYERAGAKRVGVMRSWFVPERNHPVVLTDAQRRAFECDVVFIGHYEDDQRLACLEQIARSGVRIRLFGHGKEWDPALRRSSVLAGFAPVQTVWGAQYNAALCGAKIALCFLSKLNQDTYTRRCFEIPATGTLMLSEYSDDLATLYREGSEAEFFRSPQEMIDKIHRHLADDAHRRRVAQAGCARVHADGHDVVSRMKWLMDQVSQG